MWVVSDLVIFSVIDWITVSTSISAFVSGSVLEGNMFEMVEDVEVVRGDGLRDRGDAVEAEDGFYSVMGVLVCEWGYSSVRSTTRVEVVLVFFLGLDGGLVVIGRGFKIVVYD